MKIYRPAGFTLLVICFSTTVYVDKFLREDIREHWNLHRFSFSALLERQYNDVWTQIRPESHAIYPYRAYYDQQSSPPMYRITALSKCLFDNTIVSIGIMNMTLAAAVTPIADDQCPSRFFASFPWTAYEFSVSANAKSESLELIVNRTRTKNMHVLKRPVISQKGKLEVCISGPVYWYDDWPRLIMFFELWREVHNAHFTIYVQSISKNVRMVLDHYEKLGLLTVVPWPDLPTRSGTENANKGIFQLAHTISQNDCLLRSDAEVGVLLDMDESNKSLVEFMREKNERVQDLGSLRFTNVGMEMAILDDTFNAIGTESITRKLSPTKVAYFPNKVETIWTHDVWKHVGSYKIHKVDPEEAVVVHMRQDHIKSDNPRKHRIAKLPFFTKEFKVKLNERKREIFGEVSPTFVPRRIVNVLDTCFRKLNGRTTGLFTDVRIIPSECKEDVHDLEEWFEYGETDESQFTMI